MNRTHGIVWVLALVLLVLFSLWETSLLAESAVSLPAATTKPANTDEDKGPDAEALAKIAKSLRPALVVVEYELRYDKGEGPRLAGWLPSADYRGRSLDALVRQERPLGVPGLLISPTEVISADPMIHPRFVKSTRVRQGREVVEATPQAYGKADQYSVILKLDNPLSKASPLTFDAQAEGPYWGVNLRRANTVWSTFLKPLPTGIAARKGLPTSSFTTPNCLIVDAEGTPVGVNMNTHLFLGGAWKGDPKQAWTWITAKQSQALLETLQQHADPSLFRVTLGFRSPKQQAQLRHGAITEKQVLGLLVDEKTLLVLSRLDPKITARLDRIQVHLPNGTPIEATFAHTLKDYGAFIATLSKPCKGAITLSGKDILKYEDRFLPTVEIRIQGEKRVAYYQHRRIGQYALGWRGQVYPVMEGATGSLFVFDEAGELLAFPIARRRKVRRQGDSGPRLTAAGYLKAVLANLADNADASNVPLSEDEENRLAWLGVRLQRLNPELARINQVSDLTKNGTTGALVSYVYSDSPAAEAGLQSGDILLRLHVESEPQPVEVRVAQSKPSPYPSAWQQFDKIPEQYFDFIPRPWPAAENTFTRMLTNLGFGKKFTVEYFHAGKVQTKEFAVTQSPPHYDTAKKYKFKPLGMTVRNLTYELRQYFRRPVSEPGVILSKIEPGSKASVAGLRPYEIITHVNDKPVVNVKEFEALTKTPGELRFEVKRWTRGRVVKTTMDGENGKSGKTATQPTTTTKPTTAPTK